MAERKQEKQQVLIRIRRELWDHLFDEAARGQLARKIRFSVPSLIVEELEFVNSLKSHHPEMYAAAKAAVDKLNKS